MNPSDLSLCEAAAAIRKGTLTSLDFSRALADRHDRLDPILSAMACFDRDRLLAGAAAIDRRREAREPLGPLAGVPVGVKDIYDCAGMPTGNGVCRGGEPGVPGRSAPCVEVLVEAGALVFGKTVTTDRAFLDPGPTRNPWSVDHTPGGSSSGSAAGVAAGMFPAALGSQTAGSVIRPAAYCGVVGMTLTRGRLPTTGVLPLVPSYDTVGFFVRSIDDAELLLSAWCGGDGRGPCPDEIPLSPLQRPVFLGFARHGFLDHVEDAVGRQALQTARVLLQKGAIVHVLRMPGRFDDFGHYHRLIFAREAAGVHREHFERDPDSFGPKISGLIEEGLKVSKRDYEMALEFLDRFRADMLARIHEVDAIVLPAATGGAPLGLDSTGDPLCNAPWTAIGFPAITIPCGFTDDGLPLGLQIVGKPMGERFLLRMARLCMEAIGFGCPTPNIGGLSCS